MSRGVPLPTPNSSQAPIPGLAQDTTLTYFASCFTDKDIDQRDTTIPDIMPNATIRVLDMPKLPYRQHCFSTNRNDPVVLGSQCLMYQLQLPADASSFQSPGGPSRISLNSDCRARSKPITNAEWTLSGVNLCNRL